MSHGYILNSMQNMRLLIIPITINSEAVGMFIDAKNEADNCKIYS